MAKFEMHVHTAECDKAAHMGAAEIVQMYYQEGYDGMIVTDHYFSLFQEWFADEIGNADHQKIIQRWLKGYYTARCEGEKLGFVVLPGAEVRFDGTINDYLIYGIDEEFFYHAPLLNRLSGLEELVSVLPPNACVVQAHPFRDGMTVQNPDILFGIEVFNGGTEQYRNRMARDFAKHYGKAMLSGSDFHGSTALGRGGIVTERKITTSGELALVLKSGEYSLIENIK